MNWKAALALGSVIVLALIAADAIQNYRAKMMLRQAAAASAAAAATTDSTQAA
jgi:hypothetical protein